MEYLKAWRRGDAAGEIDGATRVPRMPQRTSNYLTEISQFVDTLSDRARAEGYCRFMRNTVIGLLLGFTLLSAPLRAESLIASMSPDDVNTELAAIEAAKKIVEVGRGSLLMAGS